MFIPLRVHSVYSKGKGGLTPGELASWARSRKLPVSGLSDIENLYAWGRWRRAAEAAGVRPLYGCEIVIGGKSFLFLVKNREGYWNLMQILNRREIAGAGGLVVILMPGPSECISPEDLKPFAGEDFYLGGDFFNFKTLPALSDKFDLPVVWTNPLKYISSPERLILLHAIRKKIPFPPEKNRLLQRMPLFGPEQEWLARKKFGTAVEEALKKTVEVSEKCEFVFEKIVPSLPADLFEVSLRDVVKEKLHGIKNLGWEERQRAGMELEVVERAGFAPYFLVVNDVVRFARQNQILHNLKGSGASSYLAFLLGISHINPLEFDLYFARFLNAGRSDPPDFDLDFDSRKRDQVLTYVLEKYGRGKTGGAFVCSLKNYRARSALYETARAFGLPPDESRSLSKRIPHFVEPDYLKTNVPLLGYAEIWRAASDFKGVYCESSLHVGGVILTPSPVERYLPLETSAKGLTMSHFDRDAVEDLKLIKLDLLSIRGLAAVSATCTALNLRRIPSGDRKVFELLKQARTIGCFQVESPAMMNLLRRMRPENVFELTQALALIRPGPTESGMKKALLNGREGKPVKRDPFLARILPETGGLLLYEEQVMQIADRVAGMPADEADLLRRGLKSNRGCGELKRKFFREAGERGYGAGEIKKLWEVMEKFSSYSFNKAHSASYAFMAYRAVFLKVYHTLHYFAAVLNAGGGYYGLPEYIEEAKRCGIRILAPDVAHSGYLFEVEGKAIRVGLLSIKGLAQRTADKIIDERRNGRFESVEDFLMRVSLSKAELFSLIKAGVFDFLEPRRSRQILRYFQGIEGVENIADMGTRQKRRMMVESLGFDPEGDSLTLFEGRRPVLRIKDLDGHIGEAVELVVRVVDARLKGVNGGRKYFYLFEDETGLLEGVGENPCLTFGSPPACFLRGEIRSDGSGRSKIFNCFFLQA